jgi:signal transduction histidine kinase
VIADDLRYETRFRVPAIYREHKAISAMSVIVHGEDGPYGVLEAHSGRKRTFGPDDVHFLQAVANALSSAVGREERAAELRRYSAELETFSYTVAQELRSPLWSIRGLTQTLSKDFASRMELKRLESVQRIAGDAERMDRMIQGLLAYGRFSRVDLKPERWSLAALIPEALNRLGEEIRRSGARVDVADPLPEVLADRTALVEILVHLLSNGIKFVKPGTAPRLRLWTADADGFVRLYVEDDGTGIAPEHQERIFKIFERLQPSDGRPGSGIGLAIVARGVAWMGGRRGVESEIGKGSRFWIELPKAPS